MPRGIRNAAAPGSGWPLVGRENELAEIASALASSEVHGVVVVAGPGVGKTRLAREALAQAEARGAFTIWVQATRSAATIALGALAHLIPTEARPDDPVALIRGCRDALLERAGGRTVVVAVDDAHFLDAASAALILQLVNSAGMSVIMTLRAVETAPDAIVSLWKDDLARRVELAPLDDEQIRQMVEAALGAPVEEAVLAWLVESSRGNAMYVRELVRGALDSGQLTDHGGFWLLEGQPHASASLIDLVTLRLSELSPPEMELVQLLALGEPIAGSEALGLSSEQVLVETENQELIVMSAGMVRLSHPLYGEAVRGSLSPLRVAALCRRLITVLEARIDFSADDSLRVARLRLDAGEPLSDELLRRAADAANRAGDPDFGHQLATMIPVQRGGLPAALLVSRSLSLRHRYVQAEEVLAAVEAMAPNAPDVHDYLRRRLWLLHWGTRDRNGLAALLDRAGSWRSDPEWRRFVEHVGERYLSLEHGFGTPEAAVALAENDGVPVSSRRQGRAGYVMASLLAGQGDEAAAAAFEDLPVVSEDLGEVGLLGAMSLSATEAGYRWDALETFMSDALRQAVRQHCRAAAGIAAFTIARLHFLGGRLLDANRWLAEARSHMSHDDPFSVLTHVCVLDVGIAALSGDFDATMFALDALRERCAQSELLPVAKVHVARAEGWAARARNPAQAGLQLLTAAAELEEMPGLTPQLVYDASRCGAAAAAPLLQTLASSNRSRLVSAYAQHATARASVDGAELLAAAEEMAQIGALQYAVEAACEAAGVFLDAGREDSARRAAARARALHGPGAGWELPRIDGLDGSATALTPREEQLIGLASRGLGNAEIADRLVLSVRTVETHLYRGMQKLGISDRRDL